MLWPSTSSSRAARRIAHDVTCSVHSAQPLPSLQVLPCFGNRSGVDYLGDKGDGRGDYRALLTYLASRQPVRAEPHTRPLPPPLPGARVVAAVANGGVRPPGGQQMRLFVSLSLTRTGRFSQRRSAPASDISCRCSISPS